MRYYTYSRQISRSKEKQYGNKYKQDKDDDNTNKRKKTGQKLKEKYQTK